MSKISEMYEQIKEQQHLLVRTKLQEAVKASKEHRELSEEIEDYKFSIGEISILIELLEKQGLEKNKDFLKIYEAGYPDEPSDTTLILKTNHGIISIFADDWATSTVPTIGLEELRESMEDMGGKAHFEERMKKINSLNLNEINLEKIGISIDEKQIEVETENQTQTAEDRYTNIIMEKLRIIEQAHDLKGIPEDMYTLSEINKMREILGDKEECFKTLKWMEDLVSFDYYTYGEATNTTNIFEIGDKVVELSDFDGKTSLKVMNHEEYIKHANSMEKWFEDRGEKKVDFSLPKRKITIEEIEQVFMKDSKARSAKDNFEQSLFREDFLEYYLSKTPEELEEEFGSEVARMVGFEQKNAHHCYDLWGHALHTVDSIDTSKLDSKDARKLKVAAFFHDIGKPDVVGFNEVTQQQNFINHANHSVEVAKPILEKLGYTSKEIEELSFLIGHHDDFMNYKNELPINQKSHAFFRETNADTVAEILFQNQYDWDKLGFPCYLPTHTGDEETDKKNSEINTVNQLKRRYICSTLINGVEPQYIGYKNAPIKVDVNMEEVMSKLEDPDNLAQYRPSWKEYGLLLELCKADARAQSEEVIVKGKTVDSKERKINTIDSISNFLNKAENKVFWKVRELTEYSFEQFIKDTVQKAYGEKRPMVICKDGTEYSIQASSFHACSPREDGLETYQEFEIGNIKDWREDYLEEYINDDGIAGNVPIDYIEQMLDKHGGLDKKIMKQRVKEQKAIYEPRGEEYEKWIKEKSMGNPFVEQMLRYATRKCDLSKRNEQAKGLLNEYEQQANKDGQTQSDED